MNTDPTRAARSTEPRWPDLALGKPPNHLRPDLDDFRRQAVWAYTLWRDWPESRRDAVRALSGHLAAAIEGLGSAIPDAGGAGTATPPGPVGHVEMPHSGEQTPHSERVETAARVLHERRHPLGTSHACDRCRADARAVADVLTPKETP